MKSIFQIFKELKLQTSELSEGYNIASLPSVKYHKIGVSQSGHPMFFISCENSLGVKTFDANLEYIEVLFSRPCQLITANKQVEEGSYTVICLKTDTIDLQEYFLEIVFLIIKKLAGIPKLTEVKVEVEKLIDLFSKFSTPPFKTIQGLWAELLVIEQAKEIDYLINAWHWSIEDKFDFNDGVNKIEVKSTAKSRRVHRFSADQLHPNKNSSLIIVSVFTIETGIGKSVFNLIKLIEAKLNDKSLVFRVNEIVAQTLGSDIEKAFDVFYDYQFAIDSIQFYDYATIPMISKESIPREISNVKYDIDLTETPSLGKANSNVKLHNSLF